MGHTLDLKYGNQKAPEWKNKPLPYLATKQSQTSENRWVAISVPNGSDRTGFD
jgi:hypothetical protein